MRNITVIIIASLIVVGFLVYMSSFTVRFTEAAVVTTLGKAGPDDVVTQPGLRFKWPAPIQSTTVYDTRQRFLQAKSETLPTADERLIVVESFLTWRVKDPLKFYETFRGSAGPSAKDQYSRAQETLTSVLRSSMSEVSRYKLGELFAAEPGASKLGELEQAILQRMTTSDTDQRNVSEYGVEVLMVGINSIVLPEDTTREIFNRMSESRKRLAAKAESEGEALATAIRSEAQNSAKRIIEFAKYRADQIRNQGELEAAPFLTALNEEPELAAFIKNLDLMKDGLGKRATLVVPSTMAGIFLWSPEAMESAKRGQIPAVLPPGGGASALLDQPRPAPPKEGSR